MAFDALKNFIGKLLPHKSVQAAGTEIQKATSATEVSRLSSRDVPTTFDDLPIMTQWDTLSKRIATIKKSHYDLARHSFRLAHLDPRIEDAFNILIDKATEANQDGRPFEIGMNAEFQDQWWDELNRISEVLQLYSLPHEAAIYGCLEGECYYRAIFNPTNRPFEIHALERIPGPSDGFELTGPLIRDDEFNGWYLLTEQATRKVVAKYRGFEVIPFKRNARERGTGDPLLASTIRLYPMLEKMEEVMPIMRQYRSGASRIFKYPPMSIDEFRKMSDEQKRLEREKGSTKPFNDVHTTADVHFDNPSSPALYNIDDINYMLFATLAAVGTPIFLLATMPDKVPARGDTSDTIYDNWIRGRVARVESMLTGNLPVLRWLGEDVLDGMGILKILGIQLYLWGQNPREMGLKLEWPNKLPLTQDEVNATQQMFDGKVISKSEYARRMGNADYEAQLEQMKTDREMEVELLGKPNENEPNDKPPEDENETEDEPSAESVVKFARRIVQYANENGVVK